MTPHRTVWLEIVSDALGLPAWMPMPGLTGAPAAGSPSAFAPGCSPASAQLVTTGRRR